MLDDLLVNGVERTFRDVKEHAIGAARMLKAKHKDDVIEIRDRSNGAREMILADGRLRQPRAGPMPF